MEMGMAQKDGMNYAPVANYKKVVNEGEFIIAAIGLDHGHINGMVQGLVGAGATLKWVYDPDMKKVEDFLQKFPQAQVAKTQQEVLCDDEVKLVAAACVTSERAALGIKVMNAGKHYFTDKAPLTTLEQLSDVKNEI